MEFKPLDFSPPGMSLLALQGMVASKIQDFQSLMSECLWQGKEPEEGGGPSFPFQDTELELEPEQCPKPHGQAVAQEVPAQLWGFRV